MSPSSIPASSSALGVSLKASLGQSTAGGEGLSAHASPPNRGLKSNPSLETKKVEHTAESKPTAVHSVQALDANTRTLPSLASQRVDRVDYANKTAAPKYQLPSQLATYVDQIMQGVQGQYAGMMDMVKAPLPSMNGIPGGNALRDSMTQSLQMMANMQSFTLTMSAGDMVRSTVKGVMDKALEMKE